MRKKISWQTNLTFPGDNLSQTVSLSTFRKQNPQTSGQVVLQANHAKNSGDLNHPQVPVIARSSGNITSDWQETSDSTCPSN